MDYWGAKAVWYSSGPDGFGQWYTPPDQSAGGAEFSAPPSKDGTTGSTIDQIRASLHNSQPAHLSALADQWQNLYNMLDAIRTQLLTESTILHDEKWKSGKARDAFMTTGPGQALAYLDAWMDSAISNQAALQVIASIVLDYQGQMEPLWQEYQKAVKDAQNVSFGDKAYAWFWDYNLIGGSDQPDYDKQTDADKIRQISDVKNKYNIKAQALAYKMAQEMFGTYSTFSAGHGPLYEAPDAVVDPPGVPLVPHLGGGVPSVTPPRCHQCRPCPRHPCPRHPSRPRRPRRSVRRRPYPCCLRLSPFLTFPRCPRCRTRRARRSSIPLCCHRPFSVFRRSACPPSAHPGWKRPRYQAGPAARSRRRTCRAPAVCSPDRRLPGWRRRRRSVAWAEVRVRCRGCRRRASRPRRAVAVAVAAPTKPPTPGANPAWRICSAARACRRRRCSATNDGPAVGR